MRSKAIVTNRWGWTPCTAIDRVRGLRDPVWDQRTFLASSRAVVVDAGLKKSKIRTVLIFLTGKIGNRLVYREVRFVSVG